MSAEPRASDRRARSPKGAPPRHIDRASTPPHRYHPPRLFARLPDIARAALVFASLCAGGVVWLFVASPGLVARYDDSLVAAHVAPVQRRLDALAAQSDPRAGVTALLDSLAAVRKGDRLAEHKRAAFRAGVAAHLRGGDGAAALALGEAWAAFDPLDLDARAAQAEALDRLGRPDALAIWRELFAFAADRERFAAPIIRAALARGDEHDAATTMLAFLAAGGLPQDADGAWFSAGFALCVDRGQGFDPAQSQPLVAERDGARLRVPLAPPPGARRVRLTLPPLAALTLDDVGVRIQSGSYDQVLPLVQLARSTGDAVSLFGCVANDNRLVLTGDAAASLAWSLGGLQLDMRFALEAKVVATPSPWLPAVLASHAAGQLGAALLRSERVEDQDGRRRYQAVRARALQREPLRLALGDAPAVACVGEPIELGVRYALRVPRGDAQLLRLVLPPLAGVLLELRAPFDARARLQPGADLETTQSGWCAALANTELRLPLTPSDPTELALEVVLR